VCPSPGDLDAVLPMYFHDSPSLEKISSFGDVSDFQTTIKRKIAP